jgi:FKBP-type peptidyl-prolyl cis-trans isomerase FklB
MKTMIWMPMTLLMLVLVAQAAAVETRDDATDVVERFSYTMGLQLGRMLKQQGVDDIDVDAFTGAIADVMQGREPRLTDEEMRQAIAERQAQLNAEEAELAERNAQAGQVFLAENAKKPGVETLPSGVQYRVLETGDGTKPGDNAKVTVHYHGTKIDGTVFDSSVDRGEPASFPINGVIPGFSEALSQMREGDHWQVFIPGPMAYGERGAGGAIGPNETLVFDLRLLEVEN